MFGTIDMNNINTVGDAPDGPDFDAYRAHKSARLSPEDLVARAKASIMAASSKGLSDITPALDLPPDLEEAMAPLSPQIPPQNDINFNQHTPDFSNEIPHVHSEHLVPKMAPDLQQFTDDLEAEAEIKVRVKTGDLLYTRADLMVRRDNHLSAVVDGVLLDLGMINTDLMNAMALAHQVHVSAGHYLGGIIERRVPLVHQ